MASFAYGDDDLLRFNSRQFDFSIQFEQLFFSILPSSILIVASTWHFISRYNSRPSVAAPILRRFKAVSGPEAYPLQRLILRVIGYYRDIHRTTTRSSSVDRGWEHQYKYLPHRRIRPEACRRAVHASRQLAQSQQKPATFDIAHHLPLTDHRSGRHPGQNVLPLIARQTRVHIQWLICRGSGSEAYITLP